MTLIAYVFGIPVWWIMAGILTNGHKGAVAAGAWGLICLAFFAFGTLASAADRYSNVSYGDAMGAVVFWLGPPIALIAWGNGDAHGAAWFWTLLICVGICLAIKLLSLVFGWIARRTDY